MRLFTAHPPQALLASIVSLSYWGNQGERLFFGQGDFLGVRLHYYSKGRLYKNTRQYGDFVKKK